MGPEAIVLFVWVFGIVAGGWLVWRSFLAKSRPFALPTLLASLVSAHALVVSMLNPDPGYYWNSYVACFCASAVILGPLAHAIRWLLSRHGGRPVRPE